MYTDLGRPGGYICGYGRPSNLVLTISVFHEEKNEKSDIKKLSFTMLQLLRMSLGAPFFIKNLGGLQRPPNPQLNKARFARRLAARDIMEKITFIMEKSWNLVFNFLWLP